MATQPYSPVSRAISDTSTSRYWSEYVVAYTILRLALGVNEFTHGLVRTVTGSLSAFLATTVQQFANTPLPVWQVRAFSSVVPFFELAAGTLLILGLWTRWALTALALLMVGITFGTAMRSDWATVFIQVVYSLLYFLMMITRQWDRFSVDALMGER